MSEVNSIANLFLGNMTSKMPNKVTNKQSSTDMFSQKLTEAKQTSTAQNKTTNDKQTKTADKTQKKEQSDTTDKNTVTQKKDTKNISKKEATSKNTKAEQTDELSDKELKNVVSNQILVIMSEILEIPVEEIEMQLDEMDLKVTDLLTDEGFGLWASQMYAGEETNALLNDKIDMMQIRQLFESLENLKEDLGEEVVVQVTQELSQQGLSQLETAEEVTMSHLIESAEKEVHQNQDKESHIVEEDFTQVTGVETRTNADLGLTVPIQNFTTTTTTYQYQTDSGTMTQTVTVRVTQEGQTFIEQIDFKALGETRELNVALSPRELGQMNIKIVENHGAIVAEIKVDHEKAKDFILNEIDALKQNLEAQGINVAEVKVDIRQNDRETQMQQQRQKSSRRIAQILATQLRDEGEDDDNLENNPILSDSQVDYIV